MEKVQSKRRKGRAGEESEKVSEQCYIPEAES